MSEIIVAVIFLFVGFVCASLLYERQRRKDRQMKFLYKTAQYIDCAKELRDNKIDHTLSMLERKTCELLLFYSMETIEKKSRQESHIFNNASRETIEVWQQAKEYQR